MINWSWLTVSMPMPWLPSIREDLPTFTVTVASQAGAEA
jgi:hypothetical protein